MVWLSVCHSDRLPSRFPFREAPAVVASTCGLDYIARSRFRDLANSISVKATVRRTLYKGAIYFDVLAPEKDADRLARAFLNDEDLNANAICRRWVSLVDRFFSLPKTSAVRQLPLGVDGNSRFHGWRLSSLESRVSSAATYRQALRQGYRAEALSVSIRRMGVHEHSDKAVDVMCRLRSSKSETILRFQIIRGKLVGCGTVRTWPASYANGLRNNGSTPGAISQ